MAYIVMVEYSYGLDSYGLYNLPVAKRTKPVLILNSYGLVLYSYGLQLWPAYL